MIPTHSNNIGYLFQETRISEREMVCIFHHLIFIMALKLNRIQRDKIMGVGGGWKWESNLKCITS